MRGVGLSHDNVVYTAIQYGILKNDDVSVGAAGWGGVVTQQCSTIRDTFGHLKRKNVSDRGRGRLVDPSPANHIHKTSNTIRAVSACRSKKTDGTAHDRASYHITSSWRLSSPAPSSCTACCQDLVESLGLGATSYQVLLL